MLIYYFYCLEYLAIDRSDKVNNEKPTTQCRYYCSTLKFSLFLYAARTKVNRTNNESKALFRARKIPLVNGFFSLNMKREIVWIPSIYIFFALLARQLSTSYLNCTFACFFDDAFFYSRLAAIKVSVSMIDVFYLNKSK